jgi:hypothetical protein
LLKKLSEKRGDNIKSDRLFLTPNPFWKKLVSKQQKKSRRRRAPIDSVAHELLEPEKRKLRYIEENKAKQKTEEDEDLNFFKSILPHLKHLTPFEKLSYRVKILQVTQEFVKNTSQFQPSTSHDTHSQSHNTHPDVKQQVFEY